MTIKEVSEKFGVSQDALRYYEKIGVIHSVPRKNGIRQYGESEIANVEFVICMRNAGLPVEVLVEYMRLIGEGDATAERRREILMEQRQVLKEKIENMQKAYELLNYKVDVYYTKLLKIEQKLAKDGEEK